MYTWREIKRQRSRRWSDRFITNLNQEDREGEGGDYYELG